MCEKRAFSPTKLDVLVAVPKVGKGTLWEVSLLKLYILIYYQDHDPRQPRYK